VPPRCFGAMLHTLTGSEAHNDAVRRYGLARGVRVSDYGLFRLTQGRAGARRLGGQHEEDVFRAIGLPWIPPELREDTGEVEAAARDALPRLVKPADLLLAFSHRFSAWTSPCATTARPPPRRPPSSAPSWSSSPHPQGRDGRWRLLRALEHMRVDVLCAWQPDAKDAEDPVTDRLLDTLARHGIALEVTAAGDAPDERLIHRARQRGVRFALNGENLEELRYALDQARRGWLEKADVLNTRNGGELRAWLGRERAPPVVEP
jgi:hypothetical protein